MATTATGTVVSPPPLVQTRKRKKPGLKWKYTVASIVLGVGLIALWELLPRIGVVSPIILPPFTEVMGALFRLLQSPIFWPNFAVSMIEISLGFVLGTLIGLASGIALALWPPVKEVTYPYVVAFQAIPKIVFAPLFIAWFGYGISSKVVMAVTIAFFPVLLNTMVGLLSVPPDSLKLMKSLRANKWQTFRRVSLPFAAPLISAGVKTALTFAVIGAIVGEFVGAREGLGFLLNSYNFQMRIDSVFAVIVVLAAVGAALYFLVDWLDKKIIFWEDRSLDAP